MAKDSAIEWTDHTFNPWWGCVKISEGCKNCYAEARQYGGDWWGKDKPRRFFGEKHWQQPRKWNEEAEKLDVRHKVFCGSYCDVFEDSPGNDLDTVRTELWELIEQTKNLDWLLLTKRPQNVMNMVMFDWIVLPENLWLGVSVENQKQADIRIPQLLKIPAKVRFLSCEPLLESINLERYMHTPETCGCASDVDYCPYKDNRVSWVICGGESGSNARPMNPIWASSIRDQCQEANVPFFMKQMGTWWAKATVFPVHMSDEFHSVFQMRDTKGSLTIYWPNNFRKVDIRQFPEVA